METSKSNNLNGAENAQNTAVKSASSGPQVLTLEDGIFEFSSIENYDKTDSDAQNTYPDILRVECNSEREYFASLRLIRNKLPKYSQNCIYKIRLVAKKGSYRRFRAYDNIVRIAEPGRIYLFDITADYKTWSEKGTLIDLGLLRVSEEMHAEFFTSGENAPKLIIAKNGETDELLNEGVIDLDIPPLLLSKHYYKTLDLPDGVTHIADLYARNSILTFCDFPAEKSLLDLNVQHVFKYGVVNTGYGSGFKLNLDERIKRADGKDYYYDELGNAYWINGEGLIVRDLMYTATAPASVKELQVIDTLFTADKPVKWIFAGNLVKGFDASGNLVMINDSSKNWFRLIRNNGKIVTLKVYRGNSSIGQLSFNYAAASGNLTSVVLDNNDRIEYTYDIDGYLTQVSYPNGTVIKLSYNAKGQITQINSGNGYSTAIVSGDSSIKVTVKSTLTEIPDGSNSGVLPEMYSEEIKFEDKLTVANGEEYYKFNDAGLLIYYAKEENSVVVAAEQYTDIPNSQYTVKRASKLSLNKYSYKNYSFVAGETTSVTYNGYGQPQRVAVENTQIKSGTVRNIVTQYNYTLNNDKKVNLCMSENTEITYKTGSSEKKFNVKTEYAYDSATNLPIKKTTYTVGEENTVGKTIEEYTYDSCGNCIKVVSYNSLDAATKFVTERTYDNYGRLLNEKGQSGAFNTTYEYMANSRRISKVTNAEGTSIEYGYNGDKLVSVTSDNGADFKLTNNIEYSSGEVVKLTDGTNKIGFGYDNTRKIKKVTVGSSELQKHTYTDTDTVKESVTTNAKGEIFKVKDDKTSGVVTYTYNGNQQFAVNYDKGGKVTKITDSVSGTEQNFTYDSFDTLTAFTSGTYKEAYTYNDYGAILKVTYSGGVTRTESYTYDNNSRMRLNKISYGAFAVEPTYDLSGRSTGEKIKVNGTEVYNYALEYLTGSDGATGIPSKVVYKDGSYLQYGYNKTGNVNKITDENGKVVNYTYDAHGRLTREENLTDKLIYVYNYDSCGNITRKEVRLKTPLTEVTAEIKEYKYENGRLIEFDGGAIAYDAIGCPVRYRGSAMSWTCGGKLTAYKNSTYTYDGLGRRTGKTVSGSTVTYTYDSGDRLIKSSDGMEYFYDETGVIAFKYNGALYLYKKDVHGNINGILDSSGKSVVQYTYDAWGNHTVSGSNTALGNLNPFRYRGYFYDTDTGFYYLHTRYYDPDTGRFISQDSVDYADPETINGLNLYAYCCNNPVMNVDPTGTSLLNLLFNTIKNLFRKGSTEKYLASVDSPDFGFDIGIGSQNIFDQVGNLIANVSNSLAAATCWLIIKGNSFIRRTYFLVKKDPETAISVGSAVFGIGGNIVSLMSAAGIISVPFVGEVAIGIVSIGLEIYSLGKAFKWW